MSKHLDVAILGAGVSGLCMGIQLQRGRHRRRSRSSRSRRTSAAPGYDNRTRAPAATCPRTSTRFSFEPNPEWSRAFSPQPEIQRYLAHCAEKYELLPHIRFGTEVAGARFDERAGPLARAHARPARRSTAKALVVAGSAS